MRTSLKAGLVALASAALLATAVPAALAAPAAGDPARAGGFVERRGTDARNVSAVGLVGGTRLVTFSTASTRVRATRTVTGLVGDARLVGIDYRVQDGKLYGVGNAGGVYTIDDKGAATKVLQLSVALSGAAFGVDFNPAANALRIVSDTGQNLRQPFATAGAATVADTGLTNPAVAPATGTVPAVGVTGAAYTNNDLDTASATTLFDLDTALDRVAIQSPANAGTLAPTGGLGVDAGTDAGFDIYSELGGGRTQENTAFAALSVGGRYGLYRIDVLAGQAERIGTFDQPVSDLAVTLDR